MTSDPSTSVILPQDSPTTVLQSIITLIAARLPADMICVCAYQHDAAQLDPLVEYPDTVINDDRAGLQAALGAWLSTNPVSPHILEEIPSASYETALLVPLQVQDTVTGALAFFSHQADAYRFEDCDQIMDLVSIVRIVLENLYLYDTLTQNIIISQLILLTAQTIVDNPSPQQIIDILCAQLFESHVTSCAILLYGPVSEDRPSGPFDYLEMVGSWSQRLGSGIALGTKFYLKDYPEYLQRLDLRETLVFTDTIREFIRKLDPFLRLIIRAERIRSMTLLPLYAGQRKLGVLMVGCRQRHTFTRYELQSFQTISEFLGISAMSQILQQQRDLVQQGRAALLDAVKEGVVMVLPDAAGARVLTVNKVFTSIFGLSETGARGLLLPDLLQAMQISDATRQELERSWLNVPVRDPSEQYGEFHMVHSDGYPMDIEWYSAPVYQNTNIIMGRIYTFRDVTAERTAIRVRSAFLSRVSHELRTPLTSIHGFAEFILQSTGDELPPVAREYTEIILNSARHLRAIFRDMIDLTRADAGELKLNLQHAHLPDIIIRAVAQLEFQYKQREQTVVMDLDDDLPSVNVDVDRLMQVMTNLLTNAIKFGPEKSTIHITTRRATQPGELPAGAPPGVMLPGIIVQVTDEGPGVAAADTDQIFVPFFRTNWAQQHQIEGTGLGLAVSRSIVELHRGMIWATAASTTAPGGHLLFSLPAV